MKHPKYTHAFIDHDGKSRFYLRMPGRKRVPLPGLPWSPEFMDAREKAMKGGWTAPELGASRTKAGTVNAAIISYYQVTAFTSLAVGTRKSRRAIIEKFREEHGDKRVALMHSTALQNIFNKKSPAAQRNWMKALRGLIDYCRSTGLITQDPLSGVQLASCVRHPAPSRSRSRVGAASGGSDGPPINGIREALHGSGIWQLVPESVRRSGPASMCGPRAPKGGSDPARTEWSNGL